MRYEYVEGEMEEENGEGKKDAQWESRVYRRKRKEGGMKGIVYEEKWM